MSNILPPLYLSLGFPCQIQYIIQSFAPPFGRTPFSFSGCRRDVLLDFLYRKRDCIPDPKKFIFHQQPKGDIGVCDRNWFYWHDFGDNHPQKLNLKKPNLDIVIEKYRHIQKKWDLIDRDRKIYFFIGNSHIDFIGFVKPGETYRGAFGLDAEYVFELKEALKFNGFTNFKLIVQNRYLEDSIAISEKNDPDVIDFYFHETRLDGWSKGYFFNVSYFHHAMCAEFTCNAVKNFERTDLPENLFGVYTEKPSGKKIHIRPVGENFTRGLIERDGVAIGMLRTGINGFFGAFNLSEDALCPTGYENGELLFTGGHRYVPAKMRLPDRLPTLETPSPAVKKTGNAKRC